MHRACSGWTAVAMKQARRAAARLTSSRLHPPAGDVGEADRAGAAPAGGEGPGVGGDAWRGPDQGFRPADAAFGPAVEEGGAAEDVEGGVDPAGAVVEVVVQDVADRVADLGRGAEDAVMIPVREHPALPAQLAVQATGDADLEAGHEPGERPLVLGFDDQVKVVRLNRKMDQPGSEALAPRRERVPHHLVQRPSPEARQPVRQPLRDEHRAMTVYRLPNVMRNPSPTGLRLATSARPPPSPPSEIQIQLFRPPRHL